MALLPVGWIIMAAYNKYVENGRKLNKSESFTETIWGSNGRFRHLIHRAEGEVWGRYAQRGADAEI
jgi:hypothetical protein